jgi:hypothetical protein
MHALLLLALHAALADDDGAPTPPLPIQGLLTDADGLPLDGPQSVTFALEDASGPLWTQAMTVDCQRGQFSAWLGDGDAAWNDNWLDNDGLALTVSVGGLTSAPVPVGWAPRARYAYEAGGLIPAAITALETYFVARGMSGSDTVINGGLYSDGPLSVSVSPTEPEHAVPLGYLDDRLDGYVPVEGGEITGPIYDGPSDNGDNRLATQGYVDTAVDAIQAAVQTATAALAGPGTILKMHAVPWTTEYSTGTCNTDVTVHTISYTPVRPDSKLVIELNAAVDCGRAGSGDPHTQCHLGLLTDGTRLVRTLYNAGAAQVHRSVGMTVRGVYTHGDAGPVPIGVYIHERCDSNVLINGTSWGGALTITEIAQ